MPRPQPGHVLAVMEQQRRLVLVNDVEAQLDEATDGEQADEVDAGAEPLLEHGCAHRIGAGEGVVVAIPRGATARRR